MKITHKGITAPKGFLANGIHCGIKYKKRDLALVYSKVPCIACGLVTQNKVKAAPVTVTQAHLKNNRAQAIIINSGNANCCTGKQGIADALKTCQITAKALGLRAQEVLVASTGIIGKRLPLEKIKKGINPLIKGLNVQAGVKAAEAILTTDTHVKQISVELKIGGSRVNIGGAAKGAGMISPNLATMLAFITTDARIDKRSFKQALQRAVDNSFNLITVEGDTSTNDMVLALANGLSNNKSLNAAEFRLFQKALNFICLTLAKMIIKDAEGSTKFAEVKVQGAKNITQAKAIALKVANSALVKTALFGENPNWGRIAAAAGCADTTLRQDRLSIYLGGIKVLDGGAASKVSQQRLDKIFKRGQIEIKIVLGLGRYATRVFTCDLSDKYVKINAEY